MKYHLGTIDGEQRQDESGVMAFDFIKVISQVEFDQMGLAASIDMDAGQLSNYLNGKQKWISLKVVDRIFMALDMPLLLHQLPVIPGNLRSHAVQMAVYENLDDDDKLTCSEAELQARADQLQAEREERLAIYEMLQSDDPEAVEYARTLL